MIFCAVSVHKAVKAPQPNGIESQEGTLAVLSGFGFLFSLLFFIALYSEVYG
jgi:hypothetical protein